MIKYTKELTAEIKSLLKREKMKCSVDEFENKADWHSISLRRVISEEFIARFQDKVYLYVMSSTCIKSGVYLDAIKNAIFWELIRRDQKQYEELIEKFPDNVHWDFVCEHLKFSEDFLENFTDRIHWFGICQNQTFSKEFIAKHNRYITPYQRGQIHGKSFNNIVVFDTRSFFQHGKCYGECILQVPKEYLAYNKKEQKERIRKKTIFLFSLYLKLLDYRAITEAEHKELAAIVGGEPTSEKCKKYFKHHPEVKNELEQMIFKKLKESKSRVDELNEELDREIMKYSIQEMEKAVNGFLINENYEMVRKMKRLIPIKERRYAEFPFLKDIHNRMMERYMLN